MKTNGVVLVGRPSLVNVAQRCGPRLSQRPENDCGLWFMLLWTSADPRWMADVDNGDYGVAMTCAWNEYGGNVSEHLVQLNYCDSLIFPILT
ncbi:hypothetical protein KIN20_032460 [Parelaphostrongylus tenuis]|uniref:Uncharacterized protein n=1 Tax=Parelaphostrongylus tenuis TaxID=148309 RepID=A0AAD5R6X7_PARTN|nr:hypothetical protein KIN20_032460 [Parelaphostrongylus tenuis]